ncbi:unnamed protein product [Cylicocyclus nassatus]|uniref:Uncharacterized protein n=1 Tax=Cylicocyclus nassatus TaxID=53992 RepID=A0AA36GIZ8_CYLNA|nr:unnamed protein product [Cylicocyclus nassatus]
MLMLRQSSGVGMRTDEPRVCGETEEIAVYENDADVLRISNRSQVSIGIIEVLKSWTSPKQYETAIMSVACYAKIHGYDFHILKDTSYNEQCLQKDASFLRHCIAANALKDYDYVLFLDSDIGVVNPKRRIEEFIEPQTNIIFYDRFYNWEVMAGSYLVKNSSWSRDFLNGFANYESRLPKPDHGSDNGALHAYLGEILAPHSSLFKTCLLIYKAVKGQGSLFLYEACIREALGNTTHFGNITILPKGAGWARDPRVTNSKWCREFDFMMHNWKTKTEKRQNSRFHPISAPTGQNFFVWYNPFFGKFDLNLCSPRNFTWNYVNTLMETPDSVRAQMETYKHKVEALKTNLLKTLSRIHHLTASEAGRKDIRLELGKILSSINETWESYVI